MMHASDPAPVRLLHVIADVCKAGLCKVGLHAWRSTRALNSSLEHCERDGCPGLRDRGESN